MTVSLNEPEIVLPSGAVVTRAVFGTLLAVMVSGYSVSVDGGEVRVTPAGLEPDTLTLLETNAHEVEALLTERIPGLREALLRRL